MTGFDGSNLSVPVTAGQRLYFEYTYAAGSGVSSYAYSGSGLYMTGAGIDAKLVLVPELASLSLLALDGLAMLRRGRVKR